MSNSSQLIPVTCPALPALVAAAGERASMRFLEFCAANIRNPHTRRAYARAAEEFLAVARMSTCRRSPQCSRCTSPHGLRPACASSPRRASSKGSRRSVTCFDWLVTGQVVPVNPTGSVPGAPARPDVPGKRRCSIPPKHGHCSTALISRRMPGCAIAR